MRGDKIVKQNKKRIYGGLLAVVMTLLLGGCTFSQNKTEKIRDLEYTIMNEKELPEELKAEIENSKEAGFKYTYSDGQYLYIANGYGKQETGGYSIQMKELYLTDNAIYFKAELYGPQNGETVSKASSYPYIVIKTEMMDFPVVFE